MYEEDRELRDVMLERQALEFLLAHACETLLFYADRGNYNAADDGMEEAAVDALVFIAGADAASVRGETLPAGPMRESSAGRSPRRG
jgi:hypothetical protein